MSKQEFKEIVESFDFWCGVCSAVPLGVCIGICLFCPEVVTQKPQKEKGRNIRLLDKKDAASTKKTISYNRAQQMYNEMSSLKKQFVMAKETITL